MVADSATRKRFLEFWKGEPIEDRSRELITGVGRRAIGAWGSLITGPVTAFDNRRMLPPFIPCCRGEDTLFGTFLRHALPDAYLGYVPIAVRHESLAGRTYKDRRTAPSLVFFMAAILKMAPIMPWNSPEQQIRAVGRYFREWGRSNYSDFRAFLANKVREYCALVVERAPNPGEIL